MGPLLISSSDKVCAILTQSKCFQMKVSNGISSVQQVLLTTSWLMTMAEWV